MNGLNDMVKYCITPIYRRQQIASYFQDGCALICGKSCDICSSGALEHPADRSDDAIEVLNCLDSMQQIQPNVTTTMLTLTFRGSKSNAVTSKGFQNVNGYGKGRNKFNENGLLKFIQCLITENILHEQLRSANDKMTTLYLVKGKMLLDFSIRCSLFFIAQSSFKLNEHGCSTAWKLRAVHPSAVH